MLQNILFTAILTVQINLNGRANVSWECSPTRGENQTLFFSLNLRISLVMSSPWPAERRLDQSAAFHLPKVEEDKVEKEVRLNLNTLEYFQVCLKSICFTSSWHSSRANKFHQISYTSIFASFSNWFFRNEDIRRRIWGWFAQKENERTTRQSTKRNDGYRSCQSRRSF